MAKEPLNVKIEPDIKEGISVLANMDSGLSQGKVLEGLWLMLLEQHSMVELYDYITTLDFKDGRKKNGSG